MMRVIIYERLTYDNDTSAVLRRPGEYESSRRLSINPTSRNKTVPVMISSRYTGLFSPPPYPSPHFFVSLMYSEGYQL